jgi:hypothetical protein
MALASACFGEAPDGSGSSDPDSATEPSSSTTDASTSTTVSTSADATSTSSTGDEVTGTDPSSADTLGTSGDPLCSWELEWETSGVQDVVLVVHRAPTNLGMLLMAASSAAMPGGVHIAAFSSCDANMCGVGCCGTEDIAYEHHLVETFDMDPLAAAAEVSLGNTVLRPDVRRRVLVVTDVDSVWTPDMIAATPSLATAQIDVRIVSPAICDSAPNLETIAIATNGTYACGDLEAPMIIDDALLRPQPSCDLNGDPAEGPGPEMPATTMQLAGVTLQGAMPVMSSPAGPAPCDADPQAWTVVAPENGQLRLCPLACRDVAGWQGRGLTASVDFECG